MSVCIHNNLSHVSLCIVPAKDLAIVGPTNHKMLSMCDERSRIENQKKETNIKKTTNESKIKLNHKCTTHRPRDKLQIEMYPFLLARNLDRRI